MEEEVAFRYAEEDVRKKAREAERKRLREKTVDAHAAEDRDDRTGKWPRWPQGK
jgi:hypothetical protein